MISSLMKQIMKSLGLSQADLAEVLEVSIDRVKSLTSGRVKKLTREESEFLVDKLEIRAEWLITGDGPMLQDSEPQDELVERMRAINQARVMIDALPLDDSGKIHLKAIMTGDAKTDGDAIAAEMAKSLYQRYPPAGATTVLTARESALIDNYRASPEDGKQALETTSAALAQSTEMKKAG